jgi:hypothetical protein
MLTKKSFAGATASALAAITLTFGAVGPAQAASVYQLDTTTVAENGSLTVTVKNPTYWCGSYNTGGLGGSTMAVDGPGYSMAIYVTPSSGIPFYLPSGLSIVGFGTLSGPGLGSFTRGTDTNVSATFDFTGSGLTSGTTFDLVIQCVDSSNHYYTPDVGSESGIPYVTMPTGLAITDAITPPTPDPGEEAAPELSNTGVDAGAMAGALGGAVALSLVGIALVAIRRRSVA